MKFTLLFLFRFGFGILDGDTIVSMAEKWDNVPDKVSCEIAGDMQKQEFNNRKTGVDINEADVVEIMFNITGCKIDSLEHVQAIINVAHPNRGAIEVVLVSGARTKTRLLAPRPKDTSEKGFTDWPLMSVESWGEAPSDSWQLYIVNRGTGEGAQGVDWSVGDCRLVLHGLERGLPNRNINPKKL